MVVGLVILIVFLLFFIYIFVALTVSQVLGVPFVPTNSWHYRTIFDQLTITKKDIFYDIGSGDGSIVRYVAKHFCIPSYGVEKNTLLVGYARYLQRIMGLPAIHIISGDTRAVSYKNATLIYLYLMPELIESVTQRIERDCRTVTVISHRFSIAKWKKYQANYEPETRTYYYRLSRKEK